MPKYKDFNSADQKYYDKQRMRRIRYMKYKKRRRIRRIVRLSIFFSTSALIVWWISSAILGLLVGKEVEGVNDSDKAPAIQEGEDKEQMVDETELSLNVGLSENANPTTKLYLDTEWVPDINNEYPYFDLVEGAEFENGLKVALGKVEWVVGNEELGRQGLVFKYSLHNSSDNPIYFSSLVGDGFNPYLYYQGQALREHPQGYSELDFQSSYDVGLAARQYQNEFYVPYEDEKMSICSQPQTIAPQSYSECYLVYDYAGKGSYDLVFEIESGKFKKATLMVE